MSDLDRSDNKRRPGCMLYVPWTFDMLGGVDVVVDKIYRALAHRGPPAGSVWIGEQDWHKSGEYRDKEGRQFISLNLPAPPSATGLPWLRYAITLGRRVLGLRRLLARHGIEVVNCHFPTTNVYPLALMKTLGLWRGRLVLTFHGSDVLDVVPNRHVWRTIARAADSVTACSDWLARQVADTGLWRRDKVHVIPNGLDIEKFVPTLPSPLEQAPRRYIVGIGNFVPLKAQDVLLKAFSVIASSYPDVDLVLAGGAQKGEWLAHLKACATQLGIADRTRFLADVPHARIPALIRGAELFAHASRREGFSLVILEAGAMGRAVVATAVGGIPEIICDPTLGRLVPPDDAGRLAEEMAALLGDGALRARLGENLRSAVASRYSVGLMNDRYAQLLFGQAEPCWAQ